MWRALSHIFHLNEGAKESAPAAVVISMERHHKRYIQTRQRLLNSGVRSVTRFLGIDGFDDDSVKIFESMRIVMSDQLAKGPAGCAASHISIYKRMIDRGVEELLIFEDDAVPCVDFVKKLDELKSKMRDYDMVLLGHQKPYDPSRGVICDEHTFCLHGYLMRLKGARALVEYVNANTLDVPIDVIIRENRVPAIRIGIVNLKADFTESVVEDRSHGLVGQSWRAGSTMHARSLTSH